jgi:hypothetical protein
MAVPPIADFCCAQRDRRRQNESQGMAGKPVRTTLSSKRRPASYNPPCEPQRPRLTSEVSCERRCRQPCPCRFVVILLSLAAGQLSRLAARWPSSGPSVDVVCPMKQQADRLDPMLSSPPSILNARANYIDGELRTPGPTRHIDDEHFSTATLRPQVCRANVNED